MAAKPVPSDVAMNIGPQDKKWWINTDVPYNILPPALQAQYQNCSINSTVVLKNQVLQPGSGKVISYEQGICVWGVRWHPTLSRTFIQFKWTPNPSDTPTVKQKHFPAPDPLSPEYLAQAAATYGQEIATFCKLNLGKKVGERGECWDLPAVALDTLGKKFGLLPACGTVFGQCIYQTGKAGTRGSVGDIRPGDIVQFEDSCVFVSQPTPSETRKELFGSPKHTAVIYDIAGNGEFAIYHQNLGNVKLVGIGKFKLGDLTNGSVFVYRSVELKWSDNTTKWQDDWDV